MLEIILKEINEVLATEFTEADKDTTLEQLGADSLDALEVAMALEERFDQEFPDEELLKYTPQQIADMVKGGDK